MKWNYFCFEQSDRYFVASEKEYMFPFEKGATFSANGPIAGRELLLDLCQIYSLN